MPGFHPVCARAGLAAVFALFLASGCGREIGDSCSTNIDCSSDGARVCIDQSSGGYCSVEGCDARSCPDDAHCIRFFPTKFSSRPCDPALEDAGRDDCVPTELCSAARVCVQRSSERRFCMKSCSSNDDCRDDLTCRSTGMDGAELIPTEDRPMPGSARFCGF